MTYPAEQDIAAGTVLEFFEAKEITCGVCLAVKDGRFNVLTERNREINLTRSRVVYSGKLALSPALGRDTLVGKLTSIDELRRDIMQQVDLPELWALVEGEKTGFEAQDMAELIFNTPVTEHQIAAVQRTLLQDRLYFLSKDGQFFPRSSEDIERRRLEMEREAERERNLESASRWLGAVWARKQEAAPAGLRDQLIEHLKQFALFGQEAEDSAFIKEVFKRASISPLPQSAFRLLVRLGVWTENENLLLHEHGFSPDFAAEALEQAERIRAAFSPALMAEGRIDLRQLGVFTVDSSLTRDYDDALSVRPADGGLFEVGVHIADAAEFIQRGDPLDREAEQRTSTIYLPDARISMLPASLSEDILSLKADEDRLALSFLFYVDAGGVVHERKIVPSLVRIHRQLTYEEVNELVHQGTDKSLKVLHELAVRLRNERLEKGAVILPLPELQVYVNPAGMIQISRYEKETPSQILVSEWMIAANSFAGAYLAELQVPSIYRNQLECREETQFVHSEHELFSVYRRRRLFARAELDIEPRTHCSLAVPFYTTVTSPIRRFSDLVVQRQLKQALATRTALYTEHDLKQLITKVSAVQAKVFLVQRKWTRYWILRYLEQEDLQTLPALVLDQNPRFAHLLLPDFFIETNAPVPENPHFQQGEMVRVKIDKLIPRDDVLKVQVV